MVEDHVLELMAAMVVVGDLSEVRIRHLCDRLNIPTAKVDRLIDEIDARVGRLAEQVASGEVPPGSALEFMMLEGNRR